MNKEEKDNLISWSLNNSEASSSTIRGASPFSKGYKANDISMIQFEYSVEYDNWKVKLFFQKKTDTRGATFEVKNITEEMVEYYKSAVAFISQERKNYSFMDKIKVPKKVEYDLSSIDPDLIGG
jgi:hypothetical protein